MDKDVAPPIGIIPQHLWLEKRYKDLEAAIYRYIDAEMPIPKEWFDEYRELGYCNDF